MVLGQVSQINRYDIALALPNNLTGYVPLTAISDTLTKKIEHLVAEDGADEGEADEKEIDIKSLFSLGQYFRAYVTSTKNDTASGGKGKKRIELSINPRQANLGLKKVDLVVNSMVQATVSSIEDHGLIMNLSLEDKSIKGFMSSKEVGHYVEFSKIGEGAVYLCLITGLSSNGNIIKLSADPQKAGNVKKSNFVTDAPTIDSFLPGTAVELLIAEVTASGITGKVMGVLDVTADLVHSGATASGKDLMKRYITGGKTKARIICTFPSTDERKLGVSLLDHVVSLISKRTAPDSQKETFLPTQTLPLSTIKQEVVVTKVEQGVGLFVDVGVKGVQGFVHISRIADGKTETISESSGKHQLGSVHRGRIVGYNPMDGLFLVSLEQKIIDQPFLCLEDVRVGQTLQGTVEKLVIKSTGVSGILVNIADGITGLVPEIHFSDVHLQHPEKRFKEGTKVNVRVLSVDLERRQLRITLKKTLVNSDAAIWDSYEDVVPGLLAPGTIVSILSSGAIVQFYGPVRAFLPVSEMSESYIQDPKQHFRIGQVVNVHIVSVNPSEERMTVSCKDPSVFGASQQEALSKLGPGDVVTGIVSEKTSDEIIVELEGSGLKASLPIEHLADGSAQKSSSLAKKIRISQTLKELLVLSKQESRRLIRLTSKPSLLKAAKTGKLLKAIEYVTEGAEVSGFVNNVTTTGVFVRFFSDLTGLLLKAHLPEEATQLPEFGMRRNQSLTMTVLSVDYSQQRFLLTMKSLPMKGTEIGAARASYMVPDRALVNPVDEVSTTVDDFVLGKMTKARVVSVKGTQLNVQLSDGVQGRIDVSEVFDSWEDIEDQRHPLKKFSPKQVLPVRVMGMHDSRNHRFLPITNRNKNLVYELSAKPSCQTPADLDILTLDKVKINTMYPVYVNNVAEDCLWVNLSPNVRGRIRAMDVSDDVSLLEDLATNFPVGSVLKARVSKVDVPNNRLDLSARSGSSWSPLTFSDLSLGMVLPGRVTKVTERHIMVQLSEALSGPIYLVDMADDYEAADPNKYQKNQTIRVCISDLDIPNKRMNLSVRPSKVLSSSLPVSDPEITSISQLQVNDIYRGFVKNVADVGLFVSLSSNVTAFVRVSDLSDSFIKDWKSSFQVDQLVKGKIIAVDPLLNHVQMSLKGSVVAKDYKASLTFSDIAVGQTVTGKIRKVEDYGVFIVVDESDNVSGLCHRSQMADQKVLEVKKLYDEGDAVQAMVLKIDLDKRRISFGLKASFFKNPSEGDESSDDDMYAMNGVQLTEAGAEDNTEDDTEDEDDGGLELDNIRDISSPFDEDNGDRVEIGETNMQVFKESRGVQGLDTGGFDWTGGMNDPDDKGTQSENDFEESQSKKKRRRKAEIKVDKTGDLDAKGPQSVADFERLLLGQPNSSYLWLSYMAFVLELNETPKARGIAERAIQSINIREEAEKMNVWVALLNLENTYGSDESVEEVFQRACQYNDSQEIHERLGSIYIQSGKNNVSVGA